MSYETTCVLRCDVCSSTVRATIAEARLRYGQVNKAAHKAGWRRTPDEWGGGWQDAGVRHYCSDCLSADAELASMTMAFAR